MSAFPPISRLGGPTTRAQVSTALDYMAHALTQSPEAASTFL